MGTSVPNPTNTASPLSWTHTAAAGARVFVPVSAFTATAPTSVTYGGTAMTLLGSSNDSSSQTYLYLYSLTGAPTGAKTVQVTPPSTIYFGANSISFTGVNSVSALQPTNDGGTTTSALTQSVSCTAGQMILQCFGEWSNDTIVSYSGGTPRWIGNYQGTAGQGAITISTATATTTFTATDTAIIQYCGLAVVLS
jgi:hypothetical protein